MAGGNGCQAMGALPSSTRERCSADSRASAVGETRATRLPALHGDELARAAVEAATLVVTTLDDAEHVHSLPLTAGGGSTRQLAARSAAAPRRRLAALLRVC